MNVPKMSKARYLGHRIVSDLIDDGVSVENSPAIKVLDAMEETIKEFSWWNAANEGRPSNNRDVLIGYKNGIRSLGYYSPDNFWYDIATNKGVTIARDVIYWAEIPKLPHE